MTERSMFWADGLGDGGPYSEDELRLLYDGLAGAEDANRGVLVTQGNELAPSSTGNNNIRLAIGRAVVDGTLYENDAILDIVTASPVIGTTGRRCVLQKDWAARTVRAAIITSADGVGAIPALTQNDGTIWEIPICSFTITTGGVIGALTDQREFCEGTDSRGITIFDRATGVLGPIDTVVETTVYSFTLPAGALGVDGGIRLIVGGPFQNNSGGARVFTIRVKLGATTVFAGLVGVAVPASAGFRGWRLELFFLNQGATNSQRWNAKFSLGGAVAGDFEPVPTTAAGASTPYLAHGSKDSAEETADPLLLDITVELGFAHAAFLMYRQEAMLERIPVA